MRSSGRNTVKKFRRRASKTSAVNLRNPHRGGIRL